MNYHQLLEKIFTDFDNAHYDILCDVMMTSKQHAEKILAKYDTSKLTKEERLKNIKGAFAVTSRANVKDLNILLVDDVFTTGATTSEIAKILKKKGAKYVFVATLAKR